MYQPRSPRFPRLAETRMFGDQRLLEITTFVNTKWWLVVAKLFTEAILSTKSPCSIISDEKYWKVDETWKLAIEAQDSQWVNAAAPVGTPSVSLLPHGASLKFNPQTREAVSIYPVFCSSIGLRMILILNNIDSENLTLVQFVGIWQMEVAELFSMVGGYI